MSNFDKTPDDYFNGIEEVLKLVPKEGMDGTFPCPVCKTGTIRWLRARSNKHLRLGCSTPDCVMLLQ